LEMAFIPFFYLTVTPLSLSPLPLSEWIHYVELAS